MADYKATAAELASVANAIRLKGGTSTALEYPSEWITAIQNLVPASGGSEITPLDPTAIYKVTDTELISIANAIRAKGGTSSQLEFPAEFISAIQNIPAPTPPIEIVSWASGTDAQIVALLQAAHNGNIDLQQDCGWAIGDIRTITINAFTSADGIDVSLQDVDIVISSFDDYMDCGCVMQFDFKDSLNVRIKESTTPQYCYDQFAMKTLTIPALVNALPLWLQNNLIDFSVLAGDTQTGTIKTVTNNKLAQRSEIEITGSTTNSYSGEGTQIPYYITSANIIKKLGRTGVADRWATRSIDPYHGFSIAIIQANGSAAGMWAVTGQYGASFFGCL